MDWFLSLPTPLQGIPGRAHRLDSGVCRCCYGISFRNLSPKLMNGMLGLAGGIMLAASFYFFVKSSP